MSDAPLRFGPVELRPQERRLLVDGRAQAVGARAFDLLLALVERRERVVAKSELLELVWPGMVVEESNLPVHVSALRKTLGSSAIATIPGRGYRFTLTSQSAERAAAQAPARLDADPAQSASAPPPAAGRFEQFLEAEPLVGREEAVYDVVAALLEHRLVNIVGAGGIGKTRLARAVQRRLREDFIDGVWWVDLAAVQHAEHVVRAIAQSIGEPFAGGDVPVALARSLAHRHRMLLVLDNCEQVSAAVARVAAAMLDELPMVRLLLTSRVPLHLPAEQVWRLDALPVPAPGATLEEARACAAFELFELRARAGDQRFVIDAVHLPVAIELCRRLEGHPLAIEMAAARASQIGLSALLSRLGDRLRLLRASDPAQPERQLSLRAVLDWSCSQLDDAQRAVLRRLSVFAGSFGLDAAQQVASDAALDEWATLDALAALVDHGLVQVQIQHGPATTAAPDKDVPRYRLAETTRLYAIEQLSAAGETASVEQRHQQTMVRAADEAAHALWTMTQPDRLSRFGANQDDLQIVFDAACARGDAEVAARTGQALAALEATRGSAAGAGQRAAAARRLLAGATDTRTLGLLWNLAAPAWSLEHPRHAASQDSRARVQAWRRDGDAPQLYLALRDLAMGCSRDERRDEALIAASEMQALESQDWSPALRCEGAQLHADMQPAGAYQAGLPSFLRALELAEQSGDTLRLALQRFRLAEWATAEGPPEEAARLGELAVHALEPLHRPIALGCAWSNLCAAGLFMGDDDAARQAAAQAYPLLQSAPFGAMLFFHLALIDARSANVERAARLLAHADATAASSTRWGCRPILAHLRQLTLDEIQPRWPDPRMGSLDNTQADALAWAVLGGVGNEPAT